ncbi:MAG TPA: D-alanine--poly(phosphoribitol) ligase subunit 2 [Gemmatimonadales bacterium]
MPANTARRMTTAERVIDVLADVAEDNVVRTDPDIPLFEQDVLDSLRTVDLILALTREFGVDISPAELDRSLWATPKHIVAFMEAKVGA